MLNLPVPDTFWGEDPPRLTKYDGILFYYYNRNPFLDKDLSALSQEMVLL
jgi:hypothetical protein